MGPLCKSGLEPTMRCRLEGNWGVETRAPFNLVTFHFVHPPNVSTVVFGMKQPVLMHSRKTFFFASSAHSLLRANTRYPANPRGEGHSAQLKDEDKQQQVVMYELRCFREGCMEARRSAVVCYRHKGILPHIRSSQIKAQM